MSRSVTASLMGLVAAGAAAVAFASVPTSTASASAALRPAVAAAPVAPAASGPTPSPGTGRPAPSSKCPANSTSPARAFACLFSIHLTSQVINQGNSVKVVINFLQPFSIATVGIDGVNETDNCPPGDAKITSGKNKGKLVHPKGLPADKTVCKADKNGNLNVVIFTPLLTPPKLTNISVTGFNGDGTPIVGKFGLGGKPYQISVNVVPRHASRS